MIHIAYIAVASCSQAKVTNKVAAMAHESDPSTLSNYHEVAFTSWHLNVEANFAAKKLVGTVTLRGKVLSDKLEQVVSRC